MTAPRYFALIPAAGVGSRMSSETPKQYLPIAGKPMLQYVLATFASAAAISNTFVVVSPDDAYIADVLAAMPAQRSRICVVREGGATRQQSVLNGLQVMREQVDDNDWVLVHDAARPGLQTALIDKLIAAVTNDSVGGLLALPVVDTIKRDDGAQRIDATVLRDNLWAAQTPQMFRYAMLRRALERADAVTDEAGAVEALGLRPKLVEGNARNFKVTRAQDIALAEMYLKGLS